MAFREFVVVDAGGFMNVPPQPKSEVEEWLYEVNLDALRAKPFSTEGYRFVSSESFSLSPHSHSSVQVHIKAQEDKKTPGSLGLFCHTDGHEEDTSVLDGLYMGYVQPDASIHLKGFGGANSALGPDGLGWPNMVDKDHCMGSRLVVILRRNPKDMKINKLGTVM